MRIEQIQFRAGETPGAAPFYLNPGPITIFIGPNNGGKSRAIRDIYSQINTDYGNSSIVVSSVTVGDITILELEEKIALLSDGTPPSGNPDTATFRYRSNMDQNVNLPHLRNNISLLSSNTDYSNYLRRTVLRHFILNLNGESRLSLTNPVQSQQITEKPQTTAAALFKDDNIRHKLSDSVHDAFGRYLVVDPTSMSQFKFSLSLSRPASPDIERSLGNASLEFFSKCQSMEFASDGTRAYIGILSEIFSGNHEVLLVDEPEAFLHPGLAFSLGRAIGLNLSGEKQLIAATHSAQFLLGCISSGNDIDIVRLTYSGESATARMLPAKQLNELMKNPLLRSVGAMSALFYVSAIIVEGDADRAFYEEINHRLDNIREGIRHPIFLNARSKQTIPEIVSPLRAIGIPAVAIMDIDWIKEDGVVAENYLSRMNVPEILRESIKVARRAIRSSLEAVSLNYKRDGGVGLLSGGDLAAANAFFEQMESYGLFTVRNGELESWLSHLGANRNKSKWLLETFEAMGSSPQEENYLKPAEEDVWNFLRGISKWVENPDRLGML